MRIVTFKRGNLGYTVGAMMGEEWIVDIRAAYSAYLLEERRDLRPVRMPRDTLEFLLRAPALEAAQEAIKFISANMGRIQEIEQEARKKIVYRIDQVRFGPPILRPQKIIAIGLNYRVHMKEASRAQVREAARPVPEEPYGLIKLPSSLVGHREPIVYPRLTSELDYEGELAVVIGKRARNVSRDEAMECVLGYTVVNDITARDIQGQWEKRGGHIYLCKNIDTFTPIGPCIALKDQVEDPHRLTIETKVNGQTRQRFNTSEMIFDIPQIIQYLSTFFTLVPGDVISTGTGAGVALHDPSRLLRPRDVVEVSIENVGTLSNPVVEG